MMPRLILALLCTWIISPWLAAASPNTPGSDFFTNGALHQFEIRLEPQHYQSLRLRPREYVPATVKANGRTYTNVGVHLKGVATFRPVDDEPSLTLNFGKYIRDQRFHGLRKIHLNNGKEDPTLLCEALSAEVFSKSDVPTARVTHGRIRFQGRDLGPYVIIEGFTQEFLSRYFKDTRGNLYDSGFRLEITNKLEKLSGKGPDDWSDLKQLARAAEITDLNQRWTALSRCLDTDRFAQYLAIQVLISNWDGYALYRNNYRIYHDPGSNRLVFMPHGMDQTFSRALASVMPQRWQGLVAGAFMETPQGRELYLKQLKFLYSKTYNTETLTKRVDQLSSLLRPLVAERDPEALQTYNSQVNLLRSRIAQRGRFLDRQLITRTE